MIYWPQVFFLTAIALPGIFIAIPRLIFMLVEGAPEPLKKRLSKLASIQTLLMTFIMALAGTALSPRTGLKAPLIESMLAGKAIGHQLFDHLLAIFLISIAGSIVFFFLYYQIFSKRLSSTTLAIMKRMRKSLGLDGCILYGGIVEEILVRWGLMNLLVFFGGLFLGTINDNVIYLGIFLSGLIFAFGHFPTYLAAGCEKTRFFALTVMSLNLFVSCFLGYLFWQYGLLAAMFGHACLHILWWYYD